MWIRGKPMRRHFFSWPCVSLMVASVLCLVPGLVPFSWGQAPPPLPTGGQVAAGGATIQSTDAILTIRQTTPTAIINWSSFNIAANHTTNILQPSATAMLLNHVVGVNGVIPPSIIDGSLNANGIVFLLNQNGILFGSTAQVNVGGLVASTLPISTADFLAGNLRFQGSMTDGLIKNMGNLRAGVDGVYLFAPNVENHGVIASPNGTITLAAGSKAYLSNRPDGRGFLTELQAPAGQALNVGQLIADGGHITIAGLVVNQNGLVQANAVQSRNGKIELISKQVEGAGTSDPLARVTLGAASQTIADGGQIAVSGQQIAHDGLLQANTVGAKKGSLQVKAGAGAQSGAGTITTGIASRMIADGGDIALDGATIIHDGSVQAHSVGTSKGTVDIKGSGAVTTGTSSQTLADAGDIVIEGKTILHQGTAQANSIGDQSGHVTFMSKDNLTLSSTSRTLAQGGATNISHGGTIIGMASNLTVGQVQVEAGAVLDVRGGAAGGHGGELLLGDRREAAAGLDTVPFIGTAGSGYQQGRFRLIPTELTLTSSFNLGDLGPLQDVSLVALNNLTVTSPNGSLDLANFAPGVPNARLRLIAGDDLTFQDAHIQNGQFFELGLGTVLPRNLVGMAGNNVTLGSAPSSFDTRGSTIVMGDGGNLSLTARNGNISLIDPIKGTLSSLHVRGGGNLTLMAQKDIITGLRIAHEFEEDLNQQIPVVDSTLQGILVDGTMVTGADGSRTGSGMLTIVSKEGSLLGGKVVGANRLPGFMVRNADATVSVRGTLGTSSFQLDANGLLPDGARIYELANPAKGPNGQFLTPPIVEDRSGYLDIAMTNAHVSLEAGSHVFFKGAKDSRLVWEGDSNASKSVNSITEWANGEVLSPLRIGLSSGFQHNRLTVTSREGNIFVDTGSVFPSGQAQQVEAEILGGWLPAFTDIHALGGTVQFRSNVNVFNAPSARLNVFAAKAIEGFVFHTATTPQVFEAAWVYVPGRPINPENPQLDRWYPVDLRKPIPPELQRYLFQDPPRGARSMPSSLDFPASFSTTIPNQAVQFFLTPQRPEALVDSRTNFGTNVSRILDLLGERPVGAEKPPLSAPGLIQFYTAGGGNIRNLNLQLKDPTYLKEVVLKSGGNIENVALTAIAPQMGTETRTVTELVPLVKDSVTGLYRLLKKDEVVQSQDVLQVPVDVTVNVPKAAVRVEANGNIDLNRIGEGPSGFNITGDGVVSVRAGVDLNLGTSRGIRLSPGATARETIKKEGLIDLAVGRNLVMTQSLIMTDGGAGISIHGIDPAYIPGYNNATLHPVEVPIEVRGTSNQSAIGGNVEVGTSVRATGTGDSTGIQVRSGGSVGVRTTTPIVNNQGPTPTVTVTLEQDPTAIDVQAQGDVNVNTSRIATFAGGNIRIASTLGSINAGSGGKNEQQLFGLDVPAFDSQGRPILNPDGSPKLKRENYLVPGSGIFTFHPLDPTTLNFPKFDTPAMIELKNEIKVQKFLGRDTKSLEARFDGLSKAREREFDVIFEDFISRNPDKPEFIDGQPTGRFLPLELGDVALNAKLDIVIPPAGIRGKRVDLVAGRTLDFQGGEVQGKVTFKAQNLSGDVKVTGTFSGSSAGGGSVSIANSGGGGSVGGLSGVTGTVAATSASTSASVSSAQKATESGQEAAADVSSQQQAKQTAKKSDGKDGEARKQSVALRARRGVEIEVEVKSQAQPAS